MTNSADSIQREIKVKGQKLGTVTSFKYHGTVVSDEGSNTGGGSLKDCPRHCSSYKAEVQFGEFITSLLNLLEDETDVLPCRFHISICL